MNSALKTISAYLAQDMIAIFRVDLRDDTLRIVKSARKQARVYANPPENDTSFSEWIAGYAQSGGVHEEDIDSFLANNDIEILRDFFKNIPDSELETKKRSFLYRCINGGEYVTAKVQMVPTSYYTPQHPIIYIYIQDISVTEKSISPIQTQASDGNDYSAAAQTVDNNYSIASQSINALASIYMSLHIVDLAQNTVIQFSGSKRFGGNISTTEEAVVHLQNLIRTRIEPRHRARALAFVDLSTLGERLKDINIIDTEVVGTTVGWFRMQLIVISRNNNGEIEKVFFTTQVIDNEKKREEHLIRSSNTDELTGLYNRHAYELDTASLKADKLPSDLVLLSVDINELKIANDSLGHAAGDELITGAAEILKETVGIRGRVYRTGGDEFTVLFFSENRDPSELIVEIKENVSKWHGSLIDTLSVSCGLACASDSPDASLEALMVESDRRMYEDKNAYYIQTGKDRRHH